MKPGRMIIAAVLLVATGFLPFPPAWAGGKVTFINESDRPVEVKIQAIVAASPAPRDPQFFTLREKTTQVYDVEPPCLKGIWIDGVQKIFFPDDPNPIFRCLNLAVFNLVVTIRPNGDTDIAQRQRLD